MVEKEDKFIVIKREDYERLKAKAMDNFATQHPVRNKTILKKITGFEEIVNELDNGNKYIVCNQDEPYAELIWQMILQGERIKEYGTMII